jgi:hypothetical protein
LSIIPLEILPLQILLSVWREDRKKEALNIEVKRNKKGYLSLLYRRKTDIYTSTEWALLP